MLALSLFSVVLFGFGVACFQRFGWFCFFVCVFVSLFVFLGTFSDVFMMLACKGIKLFLLFLRKFKQFSLCCIVKKPRELRPMQVKRCRLHMVLVVLRISLMKEPGEC